MNRIKIRRPKSCANALPKHPYFCHVVMFLVLLENTLGQDVSKSILNTLWNEEREKSRNSQTRSRERGHCVATGTAALASNYFEFPLPPSSLMQLLIFPPCSHQNPTACSYSVIKSQFLLFSCITPFASVGALIGNLSGCLCRLGIFQSSRDF